MTFLFSVSQHHRELEKKHCGLDNGITKAFGTSFSFNGVLGSFRTMMSVAEIKTQGHSVFAKLLLPFVL